METKVHSLNTRVCNIFTETLPVCVGSAVLDLCLQRPSFHHFISKPFNAEVFWTRYYPQMLSIVGVRRYGRLLTSRWLGTSYTLRAEKRIKFIWLKSR